MAKATPKIEIGTMFDKNRSLHIERIQFGKKSPKYWITVKNKVSRSENRLPAVTKDEILKIIECIGRLRLFVGVTQLKN